MSQEPSASDQPPAKPESVGLAKGQEVSLGCGTLILIAIIVMIFTTRSTRDVEREVGHLRTDVNELKQSIKNQTDLILQLKRQLEKKDEAK